MARKRKQGGKTSSAAMPEMRPDAAGIDIGATEIFVAVPVDRAAENVRSFPTFTQDLYVLADWLKQCGITTVAMESTGVYWIPLFQILEERGFEVYLVNARHVKNVPGRRTDVSDCQWLQFLHSVGLLKASYRPAQEVCAIRSLLRHRESLVQMAATHVNHMQKALDQMNVQLHHVISDIVGQTGLAIVDAILAGQRDPLELAKLRGERIKASEAVIAKSLVGDYRHEHLFPLKQSLEAYRSYQNMIDDCDREIRLHLEEFQPPTTPTTPTHEPEITIPTSSHRLKGSFGPNYGEFGALTLPESQASARASRRPCLARSGQTSPSSAAPRLSLHGWDCAQTMTSAAAKCFSSAPAR
jgi:hypothetical protein